MPTQLERVVTYMGLEEKQRLEKLAKEKGWSLAQYVRFALGQFVLAVEFGTAAPVDARGSAYKVEAGRVTK